MSGSVRQFAKSGPRPRVAARCVDRLQAPWPRTALIGALVLVQALGLSACGSDSGSSAAPSVEAVAAVDTASTTTPSSASLAASSSVSPAAPQAAAPSHEEKSAQVLARLQGDALVLLIADDLAADAPEARVWTDAAKAQGVPMQVLRVKDWVALGTASYNAISGLVLPDAALRNASDAVVASVDLYARAGGRVMLVHDAMLHDEQGRVAAAQSRLSSLAGLAYAFSDNGAEPAQAQAAIVGRKARLTTLDIAPGAYQAFAGSGLALAVKAPQALAARADPRLVLLADQASVNASTTHVAAHVATHDTAPATLPSNKALAASALVTLAAPEFAFAAGSANDATQSGADYSSYLTDTRYDGAALLASSAGLVAGVRQHGKGRVLFANLPLGRLTRLHRDGRLLVGLLSHFARQEVRLPELSTQPRGVGSLLVTARVTDARSLIDDGAALLSLGAVFQRVPLSLSVAAQARESLADSDASAVLAQIQQRGSVLTELADPAGAHASSVASATGLAGTSGLASASPAQSAPAASDTQLLEWLVELQNFVAQRRTTVAVPADLHTLRARHVAVVRPMLDRADQLIAQGKLAWRTTAELAAWEQQRQQVNWQLRTQDGVAILNASHPATLKDLTWLLPKDGYGQPTVQQGAAMVSADATHWIVTAHSGASMVVHAARKPL